jgi:hypothetical protein
MPKISLWKPVQGEDYTYIDRAVREYIDMGATGVYVHKYIGPPPQSGDNNKSNVEDGGIFNETTISDVLFLENRDRKYAPDIIELRGAYQPSDTDFDLTQFGIFLSEDTIFMTFHLNDSVERLGRKIMAGDVLELPHLREFHPLDQNTPAINRFYVVEDASHSAKGYGPRWWGHLWRVRAKMMPASTEFQDILDKAANGAAWPESGGPVNPDDCCAETVGDGLVPQDKNDITDAIVAEAEKNVKYDPLWYDAAHLYVYIDPETQSPDLIWFKTGDGIPPNGIPLYGSGDTFPTDMPNKEYFLRTDFMPPMLFQRDGCRFNRIEVDQRKLPWTATNKLHDTFIDNDNITTNDDGTTMPERQALSKVVRAKTRGQEELAIPPSDSDEPPATPTVTGIFSSDFGPEFE